jgi:hypothetical protein
MSLGMVVFTMLSVKAWNYKGYALEQATATTAATKVITQMVHEIRTARQANDGSYAIKETEDNSLTIYRDEDLDGNAEKVHYFVDGDKLKKGVSKFNSGAYGPEEVKILLKYVTNEDKNEPFFYYYGNGYPASNNEYAVSSDGSMSSPLPFDVRLIRIHLWINVKPIVAPENVNLESIAELRNLNEY